MQLSVWELLLILGIVLLLFGSRKLRSLGGDLGEAIKGFRSTIRGHEEAQSPRARLEVDGKAVRPVQTSVDAG
jgi:sec-independent protein translocase protein TatA